MEKFYQFAARLWKLKFTVNSGCTFLIVSCIASTLVYNYLLFQFILFESSENNEAHYSIAISVGLVVFMVNAATNLILYIISPRLLKVFLATVAIINVVVLFYMSKFGVILDKSMIGNIFNTNYDEAVELLSFQLIVYTLVFGIIPAVLILKITIKVHQKLKSAILVWVLLIVCSGVLYANSDNWLWIDKKAKVLGGKILPWSYIANSIRYFDDAYQSQKVYEIIPDAKISVSGKKLMVLVIGETARSENFSLYGYSRETNPRLTKEAISVFSKTTSCSTYTTASVACILASSPKKTDFEPLPSFLHRLGIYVIWRANNWGEPNIHVDEYQRSNELRQNCNLGQDCDYDTVLLSGLKDKINEIDKDYIFVVLHTKGSHGPNYYSRYPARFEQFRPVCKSELIKNCSGQSLVNAYDNTILFTDYFLSEVISLLKEFPNRDTAMVYLSDHGESLGESGLYLHGTPYSFAPQAQKNIPFVIWSRQLEKRNKSNQDRVSYVRGEFTQSNVFHTVSGFFDVKSNFYRVKNDLTREEHADGISNK